MAQDYYTILTDAGLAYEAAQKAQNKPITLVAMAIGDGGGAAYNPDPAATALRREVHRQPINSLLQDANNPTWLVAEAWLADEVGGWTIREVGIYTDTGVLYAIAKYPESIKPMLASGSGKQFYVRTIFQTSNVASVVLQVDNSVVMATRAFVVEHVRDELAKLDSKQSVRVATTANIALTGLQTIDGVALAIGDRVLVKEQAAGKDNGIYVAAGGVWARAADADTAAKLTPELCVGVEQGTVNGDSLWMLTTDAPITVGATALVFEVSGGRPLATKAWIQSLRATESQAGIARSATQAATDAGDSDQEFITPAKFKAAFKGALANPGWRSLPSGEIEQWGTTNLGPVGAYNIVDIGSTPIYTHYYVIQYPVAFTVGGLELECSLACSTHSTQVAMGGESCSGNMSGTGNPKTGFVLAVSTPILGWSPTVHWRVRGF